MRYADRRGATGVGITTAARLSIFVPMMLLLVVMEGRFSPAAAQGVSVADQPSAPFRRLHLPGDVSLDCPSTWYVLTADERLVVRDIVNPHMLKIAGVVLGDYTFHAFDEDATGSVVAAAHIQYFPESTLDQDMARRITPAALSAQDAGVRVGTEKAAAELGFSIVSWGGTRSVTTDGFLVIQSDYERTAIGSSEAYSVSTADVWRGGTSFCLTVSYVTRRAAEFKAISARLIRSLAGAGYGDVLRHDGSSGSLVPIGDAYTVRIPDSWAVLSDAALANVNRAAGSVTTGAYRSLVTYQANLTDGRGSVTAQVQIRRYPDGGTTQAEVQEYTPDDVAELDGIIRGSVEKGMSPVKAGSSVVKPSLSLVSWKGTQRQRIGPVYAIVSSYVRSNADHAAPMNVKLVRVLDESRSFTLIASYREGMPLAAVIDGIVTSLAVR